MKKIAGITMSLFIAQAALIVIQSITSGSVIVSDNSSLYLVGVSDASAGATEKRDALPGGDDVKKAALYYQQAVDRGENSAEMWLNLAGCRYRLGEMERAADAFVKGYAAGGEKGHKASHLYYGAVCYSQCKDKKSLKRAKEVFSQLLCNHPDNITTEWMSAYVRTLAALNEYKAALPYMKKLASKEKGAKRREWQDLLLYHYLNLNMQKEALSYVEELTISEPLESRWWKALAHIHLNRNELKQGLEAMVIYSFLEPLTREESSLMADLYLTLEIPSKAVAHYEEVLQDRFDRKIAMRLIDSYQECQPAKAIEWIDRVASGDKAVDKSLAQKRESLKLKLLRSKADNLING